MSSTSSRPARTALLSIAATAVLLASSSVHATILYSNPGPFVTPIPDQRFARPWQVPGKEYSHDSDQSAAAPGGVGDPAQVIAWDGLQGGTADGLDYSTPAPPFSTNGEFQVDALANSHDALFKSLMILETAKVAFPDEAHLVFSFDDLAHTVLGSGLQAVTIPSAGPIATSGGKIVGGAGELSYELAGAFHPPSKQGIWATQAQINGMPLPDDVDGLDLWGPEPATTDDADKFSVDADTSGGGYSVWSYDISGAMLGSSPYISHDLVASLVRKYLELDESDFPDEMINVDALMVQDDIVPDTEFGPGDKILFSIRQVTATAAPDGFFATGSEIFYLDGSSTVGAPVGGFLQHGGHLWDKAYALANFTTQVIIDGESTADAVLDLNALEAIGIPEPASITLLLLGLATLPGRRRRRK